MLRSVYIKLRSILDLRVHRLILVHISSSFGTNSSGDIQWRRHCAFLSMICQCSSTLPLLLVKLTENDVICLLLFYLLVCSAVNSYLNNLMDRKIERLIGLCNIKSRLTGCTVSKISWQVSQVTATQCSESADWLICAHYQLTGCTVFRTSWLVDQCQNQLTSNTVLRISWLDDQCSESTDWLHRAQNQLTGDLHP
jgi:hypothetical protein